MTKQEIKELGLKEYWLIFDASNSDTIDRVKDLSDTRGVEDYIDETDGDPESIIVAVRMVLNEETGKFKSPSEDGNTKTWIYGRWC